MRTQESKININFEQNTDTQEATETSPEQMAKVCLSLAQTCIRYAQVERVPRYHENHRENDAEHSVMVTVLAIELAATLRPQLDRGLVAQYATVHDFVEIEAGDMPTFNVTDQQLVSKHEREQAALTVVLPTLPPAVALLLSAYESQQDPESRFVKAVDKLTPVLVDILGPGSQVMKEDYGVTTLADLILNQERLNDSIVRRFGEDAPEIVAIYQLLGNTFIDTFEE